MVQAAWIVLGYLIGSIPFAYLAGRLIGGKDIRRYGTRNLGGSNVFEQVSRPAAVAVGLLDGIKALLPTWAGLRLGLGLPVALGAGLAAVAGHNWSLYMRFHGGRGIASCMGVLLVSFPLGFGWMLLTILIGAFLRTAAINLIGFIALPVLAYAVGQPPAMVWACVGMLILIVAKRLEANREQMPEGEERWRVLLRRVLLDRDIEDWEAWVRRQSGGPED